jgi:hypothetical protein
MVTLLAYVRDHKVVGTRSTGNMPLKAIREVTAQFVDPPVLDEVVGDHTYKLRTEYDVWPLRFLHILAEVGGLMLTPAGRRWRMGPGTEEFIQTNPVLQLTYLIWVWWYGVNWMVAFPFALPDEYLPRSFERITLSSLRTLQVGSEVEFGAYADQLAERTGLSHTDMTPRFAQLLLRNSIERMVVDVLRDFGAAKCHYQPDAMGLDLRDLVAFEITPLGAALLDSLLLQGIVA